MEIYEEIYMLDIVDDTERSDENYEERKQETKTKKENIVGFVGGQSPRWSTTW